LTQEGIWRVGGLEERIKLLVLEIKDLDIKVELVGFSNKQVEKICDFVDFVKRERR
jgi:hypothetical protein